MTGRRQPSGSWIMRLTMALLFISQRQGKRDWLYGRRMASPLRRKEAKEIAASGLSLEDYGFEGGLRRLKKSNFLLHF